MAIVATTAWARQSVSLLTAVALALTPYTAANAQTVRISAEDAAQLPDRGAALGIRIEGLDLKAHDDQPFGAYRIVEFLPGSLAERDGLTVGDLVLCVADTCFRDGRAMPGYVKSLEPGQTVRVDFVDLETEKLETVEVPVVARTSLGAPAQALTETAPATSSEPSGPTAAEALVIGGAAIVIGCLLLGCGSSGGESQTGESYGSDGTQGPDVWTNPPQSEPQQAERAPETPPIDPFYGSCHGGALYGC